jgi:hypothetical protein
MNLFDISKEASIDLYDLSVQFMLARFHTHYSRKFFLEIDQILTPIFRHLEKYRRML